MSATASLTDAALDRPLRVGGASRPVCPTCETPLGHQRLHATPGGAFFGYCDHRSGNRRQKCGQHVYVLGLAGGVSLSVAVSRLEFEQYREDVRSPREILCALGVLCEGRGRA